MNPPATTAGAAGAAGAAAGPRPPFLTPVVLSQSDLPALAQAQLRAIQAEASAAANSTADVVIKAHWSDIVDRVADIVAPTK